MAGLSVGLDAAADLAAVVAGQAAVDGRRVGVVDAVVRRADQRAEVQRLGRTAAGARRTARPAALVAIGLNSPRISAGASGFMSHMSRWLGPAVEEDEDAGVGRRRGRRAVEPPRLVGPQQAGQAQAPEPDPADLQASSAGRRAGRDILAKRSS